MLGKAFGRVCLFGGLLGVLACSSGDFGKTGQAVYSDAQADWSQFPDGYQCLVAVQIFYPNVFNAPVPIAPASWYGTCGKWGACHIWYDAIPDGAYWERIANDGSEVPSTYDMIVFPETATNDAGHIASVDHVDDQGNVYVMDDNFNLDERKASQPHTVSRGALGWYHLRSLPKTNQQPSPPPPQNDVGSCPNNGLYCGGDYIAGDPSTLYQCVSHELHVAQTCADGCQVNPAGVDDACKSAPVVSTWCPNDGLYCGGDYVSGDASTLYVCSAHQLSVYEACANGCAVEPNGYNDYCN